MSPRMICTIMLLGWALGARALWADVAPTPEPEPPKGRTFYVRQTVGNDRNDGLSPQTAWRSVPKLSYAMQAGDTAFIGPGLYREEITVMNSGAPGRRITFIADTTGQHTGDPPGIVMLTGGQPVDENVFQPHTAPGVYKVHWPAFRVMGVVEMDGSQYRYTKAEKTAEHLVQEMKPVDVVAKLPASYHYDDDTQVLYIHTSDGKHPNTHEIELVQWLNGISMVDKHYVTAIGFTFRHFGDAGINFFKGSSHGIAVNNTSYGSRQGIRVYAATNIVIYANTLFRNENSGVYFAASSVDTVAARNIAYENDKGVRWSSYSNHALALDNIAFDNHEAGIAIENIRGGVLQGNRLGNNRAHGQIMVITSDYRSDGNCFESGAADQVTADFYPMARYNTLQAYQAVSKQDLDSREGGCGPWPEKVDVHRLHEQTQAYADAARQILKASTERSPAAPAAGESPSLGEQSQPLPAGQ